MTLKLFRHRQYSRKWIKVDDRFLLLRVNGQTAQTFIQFKSIDFSLCVALLLEATMAHATSAGKSVETFGEDQSGGG